MDHSNEHAAPSLRRLKNRAKEARKHSNLSLGALLKQIAVNAGFDGYTAECRARLVATSKQSGGSPTGAAASPFPPTPSAYAPCYGVVIGRQYWYVDLGSAGPQLWRRPVLGPSVFVTDLGVYQALRRDVVQRDEGREVVRWSVSRYGLYDGQELHDWTERDSVAMALHFGLPTVRDGWLPNQKELSEQLFLCSRAFAAVRAWVRAGWHRPGFSAWSRGLTHVWNLLVLLDDKNFDEIGHEVVAALFDQSDPERFAISVEAWSELRPALEQAWPDLEQAEVRLHAWMPDLLPPHLVRRISVRSTAA